MHGLITDASLKFIMIHLSLLVIVKFSQVQYCVHMYNHIKKYFGNNRLYKISLVEDYFFFFHFRRLEKLRKNLEYCGKKNSLHSRCLQSEVFYRPCIVFIWVINSNEFLWGSSTRQVLLPTEIRLRSLAWQWIFWHPRVQNSKEKYYFINTLEKVISLYDSFFFCKKNALFYIN